MILGWKIASIVITSLYVINLILKLLINKTNILNKIFATKISQIIHYLFYIIVNYSLIVILVLAHFLSGLNLGFYILGVVFFVCLIFSMLDTLLKDLSGQRPKNRFGALTPIYKLGCILDFIVFIFISVILLYNISDNVLQNILITIYSAVVGGSLTLIGVLITIKNQEKIRKEEIEIDKYKESLKYKPYFSGNSDKLLKLNEKSQFVLKTSKSFTYDEILTSPLNNNDEIFYMYPIRFLNSDNSNFIIEKITINNEECKQKNILINKNETFDIEGFEYIIDNKDNVPKVKIFIKDFLENKYVFKIKFNIVKEKLGCLRNNSWNSENNHLEMSSLIIEELEEIKDENK